MSFLNYFKKSDKNPPSLLKDPISQLFIRIAVPSSVGTVFMTLYNVVDTFFAGKISAEALAALAQTFPVYFIIIAMGVGLSIGTTSLISNAIGEKKDKQASFFLAQSILISIITSYFCYFIRNIHWPLCYFCNERQFGITKFIYGVSKYNIFRINFYFYSNVS